MKTNKKLRNELVRMANSVSNIHVLKKNLYGMALKFLNYNLVQRKNLNRHVSSIKSI